jgi:hypothetical protein
MWADSWMARQKITQTHQEISHQQNQLAVKPEAN